MMKRVWEPLPPAFEAVRLIRYTPDVAAPGVPENTPVEPLNAMPVGNVPVSDHEVGVFVALGANVWPATDTEKFAEVALVMTGAVAAKADWEVIAPTPVNASALAANAAMRRWVLVVIFIRTRITNVRSRSAA